MQTNHSAAPAAASSPSIRRFGELTDVTHRQIETADADTLLPWSERVLMPESLENVMH